MTFDARRRRPRMRSRSGPPRRPATSASPRRPRRGPCGQGDRRADPTPTAPATTCAHVARVWVVGVVVHAPALDADLERVHPLLDGRVLGLLALVEEHRDRDRGEDADDDDHDQQLDEGEAPLSRRRCSRCRSCRPRLHAGLSGMTHGPPAMSEDSESGGGAMRPRPLVTQILDEASGQPTMIDVAGAVARRACTSRRRSSSSPACSRSCPRSCRRLPSPCSARPRTDRPARVDDACVHGVRGPSVGCHVAGRRIDVVVVDGEGLHADLDASARLP